MQAYIQWYKFNIVQYSLIGLTSTKNKVVKTLQDEIGTEYAVDVIRSAYEFHCAHDINMYFSINLFFHAAGINTASLSRGALRRQKLKSEPGDQDNNE